jgi:hypothetical protein
MRKMLLIATATFAIMLAAAIFAAPASALGFGYGQIGGYDRGGYEFSR